MKDALLIHLADGAGPWWLATDTAGNGIGLPRRAALAEAAPFGVGRVTVALVPGERVLTLAARVPTRNRERLAQAVPGALEDLLADDIENLHFATAPGDDADGVPVAVVARDELAGWLDELRAAGLDPRRMVPDYLALPESPDAWQLLVADGRVLLRAGAARGWATTAALAPAALAAQLRTPPARLVIHAADDDAVAAELAQLAAAQGVPLERHALEPLGAARLLARGAGRSPLDLRQGAFRVQGDRAARTRRWRLPLALAGAWLALAALSLGIAWWRLAAESRALDAELRATYAPLLPADMHPDTARDALLARVGALASGDGGARFIAELGQIGAALTESAVELAALAYDAGGWSLKVRAADIATLERARDRLAAELGRAVTLAEAANDAGRVEGRLTVGAAP